MPIDFTTITNLTPWAFILTFFAGILTSIGPCNIAMIPLVVAFVAGQKQISRGRSLALSSAFALGLAITLMILGVLAALVGGLLGVNNRIWYYVVAAVCIVMGLQWLGVFTIPLPEWGVRLRERITRKGVLGALLLGLVSGLVASGCATPAMAAILTLVIYKGALVYGASLLLVYGLGRGVPIIILGTFAGLIKLIPQLVRWARRLEQVSGVMLILIGIYFIWIA
ncbi:MAG: cytochrome c biogenesis CcdA family protein [Anaerolineae bacterium]